MKAPFALSPACPRFGARFLAVLFLSVSFAEAQQPQKIPTIGYLGIVEVQNWDDEFRKGLRELGYVEGQSIHIESRFAQGRVERLSGLAEGLVKLKVDLILASGTQALDAARRATRTIPIVFPVVGDPVESGHVASLARPGGNYTGLSTLSSVTAAKRVELLKEVMPQLSLVALLWNPGNSGSPFANKVTQTAAERLGMRVLTLEVRGPRDVEAAFQAAIKNHAGAFIVANDSFLRSQQGLVLDLAAKHRLPGIFGAADWPEAGGLMSYGADTPAMYRRSAAYVDKILKGAKPGDLPIEQPTTFELTINMKAARQVGLTIPKEVLFRADRVIE